MQSKKNITKTQWTKFWNDVEVYVRKPTRFLKNYNPRRDEKRLIKIGVPQSNIDKIRRAFERTYRAPLLQFHKFVIFFSTDSDTVVKWTSSRSVSEAFAKLFRKLHFNSFISAKKSFHQLFLLYKLNDRGEGRMFEAKYTGHGSIQKLDGGLISGLLSTHHENAS